MNAKAAVIIVAAGQGVRFKAKSPKALVLFKGQPLICHSLKIFEQNKGINGIIVVGHSGHLGRFEKVCRPFKKVQAVVAGGQSRAESVQYGLAALGLQTKQVLVHDAARPLVDQPMVDRVLKALGKDKAAIAAVPVKATIKQVNAKTMRVRQTLRRDELWEVQTPQGFDRAVLEQAHAKHFKGEATDDAVLVEALGIDVKVVMGDYRNIKITTPEDIKIAECL